MNETVRPFTASSELHRLRLMKHVEVNRTPHMVQATKTKRKTHRHRGIVERLAVSDVVEVKEFDGLRELECKQQT
jgi:hypothetical protein